MKETSKKAIWAYIGLLFATFITEFVICGSGLFTYSAMTEFDSLSILGLAFTFESIARCVMLPVSGKIGDRFGRKKTFIMGMSLYAVSSAICALSQGGAMFIAGRALMGLSWGIFMVNMLVMIADIFGTDKSPKYAGFYQSVLLFAMVIAAPVCGVIIDNIGWRFEFWIAVPFSVLAAILVAAFMPDHQEKKAVPMDLLGIVLLTVALAPFSLAMSWGGSTYAWNSPVIIGLLATCIVAVVILIPVQKKAADPIIPFKLFNNRSYMMMMGMAALFSLFQASLNYLPTYLQAILGKTATVSSFITVPGVIISVILASILGSIIQNKPRFKGMTAIFTFGTIACGIVSFFVGSTESFILLCVAATIIGVMNSFLQVAPYTYPYVAIPEEDMSASLAFITFSTVVANTLGTAIFSAILNASWNMLFKSTLIVALLMLPCWLAFKDKK